eukprot:COSAG02_NODE_46_length_45443_cov_36.731497_35_plen_56_part_00
MTSSKLPSAPNDNARAPAAWAQYSLFMTHAALFYTKHQILESVLVPVTTVEKNVL